MAKSWRQELKQTPSMNAAYWFAQLVFLRNLGPPAQRTGPSHIHQIGHHSALQFALGKLMDVFVSIEMPLPR